MTEVLSAPTDRGSHYSGLRRTSSHSYISPSLSGGYASTPGSRSDLDRTGYGVKDAIVLPSSVPPSPQLSSVLYSSEQSYSSTPASSVSLEKIDIDGDDEDLFPSYDGNAQYQHHPTFLEQPPANPPTSPEDTSDHQLRPRTGSLQQIPSAGDDQTVEKEPTRHVDYLSHDWKEEDIWSSWRYIVARRGVFSNSVRLENASWRTWAKAKHQLKTVSPETLNWLKDCDVTWLYGPLQTDTKRPISDSPAAPSQLHVSSSFLNKKPILKKKSASEAILQRSISSHSLLKHAGAILKAQESSPNRARPSFSRAVSDFAAPVFSRTSAHNTPAVDVDSYFPSAKASVASSGLQSPGERRHISFNDEVVQCIAVEGRDGDEEEEEEDGHPVLDNDEKDEDEYEDMVTMRQVPARVPSNKGTPRGSFSNESKTIAPLPSTTLKYRGDTPDPSEAGTPRAKGLWPSGSHLSPSPSQETLRPSKQSVNFLLDDDDEDADLSWRPSSQSYTIPQDDDEDETDPGPGMHRTPSGMFMPYDEEEEEAAMNNTLFGKVVDTVNTARDIAHVIWNVGWRR